MRIKCVSLWNPWAWAMWNGLKKYETRSANAPVVAQLRGYDGLLGIHAAKMPMLRAVEKSCGGDIEACKKWMDKFLEYANDAPVGKEYYGVLGGICHCGNLYQAQNVRASLSEMELFFGDYSDGRRAIHCHDMFKLPEPIPMKGTQSVWDWEVPEYLIRQMNIRLCATA